MTLKPGLDYQAVVHTSCGDFRIDLLERTAPLSVNNFVFLARRGFYNGLVWNYVKYDSLIQAGDPDGRNGVPPDGPGYVIPSELSKKQPPYVYGAVSYALASGRPDSAGSQFFIVVHDLPGALRGRGKALRIERKYTVFGLVPKKFFGSLNTIAEQPTVGGDDPLEAARPQANIYIEQIEIEAAKPRSKR